MVNIDKAACIALKETRRLLGLAIWPKKKLFTVATKLFLKRRGEARLVTG